MTSWGIGRLDLFILGSDSFAYHKAWDNATGWSPSATGWSSMGGVFSQPPVAVAWEPNRLDVFTIDFSASLRQHSWDGTQWWPGATDWYNHGGQWMEKPTVVSWGPNRLDVFLIGTDRSLNHRFWDGSSWNDVVLGGTFAGPPTAVSPAPGFINVFCTGLDGVVYHKWLDSTGWHPNGPAGGFESMGGGVVGQPKAVSWGPDRIDLFAVGENSALWHKWWDRSFQTWRPNGAAGTWESLGGTVRLTPEAVSWGPGHLDVFILGLDSSVLHKSYDEGRGWSPGQNQYESLSGTAIREIKAVSWGPQRIDLFIIGANSGVYNKAWTPAGWTPPNPTYGFLSGSSISPVG